MQSATSKASSHVNSREKERRHSVARSTASTNNHSISSSTTSTATTTTSSSRKAHPHQIDEEIHSTLSEISRWIDSNRWCSVTSLLLPSSPSSSSLCFVESSNDTPSNIFHRTIGAISLSYLCVTLYDVFISRMLNTQWLATTYLILFSLLYFYERLYHKHNKSETTNTNKFGYSSGGNVNSSRSSRYVRISIIGVTYLVSYLVLIAGIDSPVHQQVHIIHFVKWLLVPLVVSILNIARLWVVITVYLMHMLLLLALPSCFSHISSSEVYLIISCLIPLKLALLFLYFAMLKQHTKLQQHMKHCFDLMVVASEAIVIHKDGKILDVNPAFLKLFKYSYGECKDMSLGEIFVDTPLNCLKGHQEIATLARSHSVTSDHEDSNTIPRRVIFECIGKTKSGSQIPLEVISRIQNYLGDDVYVLGIRSINSRMQKDTVLEDVDDLRAKSRFLSIVSHELKTPLNAIQLLGEMIQEECAEMDDVRENAKIIQKSAQHLLIVIKDILDYSKLEVGTLTLNPETFDLPQSVEDVIDVVAQNAYEKGLELAVYIPKSMPRKLVGDSNRFQQILSNLVSNAVKFTDNGQIIVNIDVKEETNTDIVIFVRVRDSGIGISRADQRKLFRMFSQVDNSAKRKYDGTGLGLAICKQLVTLMEGDIGVKSSFGNGAEFWFDVRLKKPSIDPQNVTYGYEPDVLPADTSIYGPTTATTSSFNIPANIPKHSAILERRRSRNAVFVDVNGDESTGVIIVKTGDTNSVIALPADKHDSVSSVSSITPTPLTNRVSDSIFKSGDSPLPITTPKEARVLVICKNTEVATILCKYLKAFGAKYITAASIRNVLDDILNYLEEPVQTVLVDEACLNEDDAATQVKNLRKQITGMNRKHFYTPDLPLFVLMLFSKAAIEDDLSQQFKIFIRKPLYLSPMEKLFYNDMVVHKRYPGEYEDNGSPAFDISPKTEDLYGETITSTPRSRSMTVTTSLMAANTQAKRRLSSPMSEVSEERIFVNFEVRQPRRRFSSFIRRSSFPVEKVQNLLEDGRRRSMVPELLSFNEISRFKSPRNTRLSLFAKLMVQNKTNRSTAEQYIDKVLDKVQRLRSLPRLLMVEDQIINLKVTKRIIEAFGVQVEVAENGREALEVLKVPLVIEPMVDQSAMDRTRLFEYDLILTDGNMPQMDGIDLTRRIRNFESALFSDVTGSIKPYQIPIIGLTAASEDVYQQRCRDCGMDEVLTKPIRRQELELMLERYLQENEEWKQLQKQRQNQVAEMKNVTRLPDIPDFVYNQFSGFKFGSSSPSPPSNNNPNNQ
jgi:signal transduction histidine kinase/DNA-binding response OmpR family regulator